MDKFALNFKGDVQLTNAMQQIPIELRERFIPAALRAGGRLIVARARRLVPVDRLADPKGLLKKSLGLFLRGRRGRPKYVVFGARRGFAAQVTRPILIDGEIVGSATRKHDPANIAHLVEFGHFVVVPRRGASIRKGSAVLASGKSFVQPRPFLRPAMIGARDQVRAAIIKSLRDQLARYLQRASNAVFRRAA